MSQGRNKRRTGTPNLEVKDNTVIMFKVINQQKKKYKEWEVILKSM